MPRGDGTGPYGRGPMTGRGAGFCAGYGVPGYASGGFGRGGGTGRGMGYGRGLGRGYRGGGRWRARWGDIPGPVYDYGYPAPVEYASTQDERRYLEDSLERLEEQVGEIRERLKDLSG